MKNIRILGFPSPEDQDDIQFVFFKQLSYSARMLIYLGLISIGFILQIFMLDVIPGIFIVIFASLLMIVKGNTTKPEILPRKAEDTWSKTSVEKIYHIKQMKKEIDKWDRDALDISNGLGCFAFIIALALLVVLNIFLRETISITIGNIVTGNLLIFLISIWFNGMRTKGHQETLYLKADIVIECHKYFEKIKMLGENFVPSIILRRGKEGKELPTDCRFNIVFDNAPADFYGVQAQTNINVANGEYPYFYCVITAKEGLILGKYKWNTDVPKSICIQYSRADGVDVVLVRQKTTNNSGYHTDKKARKLIFDIALTLARNIVADTAKPTS